MHVIRRVPRWVYSLLSSYGLAVTLIGLMFLLTFFGTLEQVDRGLHEVQKKYFESLIVTHEIFGLPIPLPGGFLVMGLFTLNLVLGGIVRIRKRKASAGILIAHLGILLLMAGGFITYAWSDSGYMRLLENESSDEFVSYYEWDIEIGRSDLNDTVLVIPHEQIVAGRSKSFYSDALPFEVYVSHYAVNAVPTAAAGASVMAAKLVGGYTLQALPQQAEAEQNIPGAYVSVVERASGHTHQAILWGSSIEPATIRVGDETYTLELTRRRFALPFAIRLDKFTRELHPGTQMAASFESEVTRTQDGVTKPTRIYMNHPLRKEGYTFFQASWGPQNAPEGTPLFSVFSVVRNPADHFPLYACIVVSIGLLIHFAQKLSRYVARESQRQTA